MIEVFKTNATNFEESQLIIKAIQYLLPESKINIDLHDCDKVLRIESHEIHNPTVVDMVTQLGFFCEILV